VLLGYSAHLLVFHYYWILGILGLHISYELNEDGNIPLKRIAQQVTRRMEHDVILKVLQANHWNRRRTAEILKISYRALLYKVRQAGLPSKRPARRTEIELDEFAETQS